MTTPPQPACVIYDEACAFCRRQVARIRRLDPLDQFEYLPSRVPDLFERFPQLTGHNLTNGMRLVEPDGRAHAGADAVYAITRRLPGWRRLAWLYRVPGLHALARALYRWIAANRYRLGGACGDDACDPPPAGPRSA